MDKGAKQIVKYFTVVVIGFFFFFYGLIKAKSFLAPLAVAILLAMVVLPVARWFERRGLGRGLAGFLSVMLILSFFVLIGGVVTYQVKSFSEQWPQTKQRLEPKIDQLERYVEEKTGFNFEGKGLVEQMQSGAIGSNMQHGQTGSNTQQGGSSHSGSSLLSVAGSFLMKSVSFLGTFLLTFIYIFFFLLYRNKFRKSIVKMVPDDKKSNTDHIIVKSAEVSQNYLFGKLILIVILAVFYSVGLSVSGVEHAILISILAAVLTLLPYIGNIIGYTLALAMALFGGAGATGVIGVSVTFAVAQFVESYILEPFIVGDKVDLNPVFTIIIVVLGGAIWGVIGMLIAIPALGIAKVIFDNIPALNPLGYLLGVEDLDTDDGDSVFTKTKRWALRKFKAQ